MYKYNYTPFKPLEVPPKQPATMSVDTITIIDKIILIKNSPINVLPFITKIQYIIYEHVYGSDAYRKHKEQLTTVLTELVDRLSVKIDLEANLAGIHRFLDRLIEADAVETYRVLYFDQPDEMHLDGIYPDGVLFPNAETSIVVNIIWRDDIIGPTDICIQHDDTYGSIIMTPEFFEPTDSELLYNDEIDTDETYIRAHVDINEMATDILHNLIYTEEKYEKYYEEYYEEYEEKYEKYYY